jgi:type I restriction enzyme S subunit
MAEWKPIYELFDFEKGSLQSSKCTPGKYTFITAAEDWKTHSSYTHDCEALIFAMAASGSLGRTHYIKDKFISSDLCFILTQKKGLRLDLTFYHRLFNFLRSDIVKKTATGTSKLAINQTNFGAYRLPYFDYDHQLIFRDKIEKINSISESFSYGLEKQLSLFKQLRQAILQEAIEGKLTADWRKMNPELISGENHASKLLEKIKAEKARLIKEGKIKKEKQLAPITLANVPFELTDRWVWCSPSELGIFSGGGTPSTHIKEYWGGGIPWITPKDMKTENIYTSELNITKKGVENSNAVLLPSNTLIFVVRSGILKRIIPISLTKVKGTINQDLKAWTLFLPRMAEFLKINIKGNETRILRDIIKKGMTVESFDFDKFKSYLIPLPPLAEQQAIVERVDKIMAMIDELEKQVTERKDKSERLMQSVLREAFT